MKRLIINGDDFGMNERCSTAIKEAFSKGLITDTTMMANGEAFDKAVVLAKEGGFFNKIGIHFNLTEGEPLTEGIKSVQEFISDGRFHKPYFRHPYLLDEREKEAVYLELSAQAERLEKAGILITHADSHHYIHNEIGLSPIVAKVCKEHGIKRIRLNRTFDTPENPRITENRIKNEWWREQGFLTTDHFGRMSDITQTELSDNTEIMVHPDFDKDGVLIDRSGMENGFPVGKTLSSFSALHGMILTDYRGLSS